MMFFVHLIVNFFDCFFYIFFNGFLIHFKCHLFSLLKSFLKFFLLKQYELMISFEKILNVKIASKFNFVGLLCKFNFVKIFKSFFHFVIAFIYFLHVSFLLSHHYDFPPLKFFPILTITFFTKISKITKFSTLEKSSLSLLWIFLSKILIRFSE